MYIVYAPHGVCVTDCFLIIMIIIKPWLVIYLFPVPWFAINPCGRADIFYYCINNIIILLLLAGIQFSNFEHDLACKNMTTPPNPPRIKGCGQWNCGQWNCGRGTGNNCIISDGLTSFKHYNIIIHVVIVLSPPVPIYTHYKQTISRNMIVILNFVKDGLPIFRSYAWID